MAAHHQASQEQAHAYQLPQYVLQLAEARGFGLLGEYFNNRWTFGDPVFARVDAKVDFVWSDTDALTPTGQDYISIRYDATGCF